MRLSRLARSTRVLSIVLTAMLLMASVLCSHAAAAVPAAPPPDRASVQAPAPPRHASLRLVLLIGGAAASAAVALGMASTVFGSTDGLWEVAANWSNGVPLSTTSAIVSTGIPILPERNSAITKNLSGGGTIGICPGGVNKLTVVAPSASYAQKFTTVESIEHEKTGTDTPRGHG